MKQVPSLPPFVALQAFEAAAEVGKKLSYQVLQIGILILNTPFYDSEDVVISQVIFRSRRFRRILLASVERFGKGAIHFE